MSISIAVLPLAIAAMPVFGVMRLTMGKEKFDAWMDADIVHFYTNFRNQNELIVAVKKAGYDASEWGKNSIKTHIDKEFWFFWEIHKNSWTMRINKNADRVKIKNFMRQLEERNQRQIFIPAAGSPPPAKVTANAAAKAAPQPQRIMPEIEAALPTIYTDQALLLKTLRQYGIKDIQAPQDTVICSIQGYELRFYRDAEERPYQLAVKSRNDLRQLYAQLNSLNEGYQSNVQEQVYVDVKKKLEDKQAVIENEEILEDNSILLTVNI